MTFSYPELATDWVTTTYGHSFNDNIHFPTGTIFYVTRADRSMRFAYVKDGSFYNGGGSAEGSNGMSITKFLVDPKKRGSAWTCG